MENATYTGVLDNSILLHVYTISKHSDIYMSKVQIDCGLHVNCGGNPYIHETQFL